MIKKADIILGIVLLVLGACACAAAWFAGSEGAEVVVTVNGEVFGIYNLSEDQKVEIDVDGHHNKLEIRDGKALMTEADCPDGYCMHQYASRGGINSTSQNIVCLPNKILVSIEGEGADSGENDAIVG